MNLLQLIGPDTRLKKVSGTSGGEWHGPCPFCGGKDRFWVQPKHGKTGRWRCRQCDKGGDAYRYVMEKQGVGFREAKRIVDNEAPITNRKVARMPEEEKRLPARSVDWQRNVQKFVLQSWNAANAIPGFWEWLAKRGINETIAVEAKLGASTKSFDRDGMSFYRGIVIPSYENNRLVYCKVRTGKGRYLHIKGGDGTGIYSLDKLPLNPQTGLSWQGNTVILVETELDALMLRSVLSEVKSPLLQKVALSCITPLAVGTAKGGRQKASIIFGNAASVLVALDADDTGDEASKWWMDRGGVRLRPHAGDPGEMFESEGAACVIEWVKSAIM